MERIGLPSTVRDGLVQVTLVCGHQVTPRNPPMSNKVTYTCSVFVDGKRCGYVVAWRSFRHGAGYENVNPLYAEDKEEGEK